MTETDAAAGTRPAAVEIQGASKIFNPGRHNEVKALEDIDLHIDQGDFVTLIGPSGCGKSTLLRLIAALVDASEGTVVVNGKTADRARLDRDYSMVFQSGPVRLAQRLAQHRAAARADGLEGSRPAPPVRGDARTRQAH